MSAPADDAPVLEVRRLRRTFDGFAAVSDVSFAVARGEVRGLIGPNGAGKTTLMHLIYGRELADAGTIAFAGGDVTRAPAYRRARTGMAMKFQVTNVFDELTVEENLRLGLYARRGRRRSAPAASRLRDTLELVRLAASRDVVADELSHGQRQWLEIGMVLLTGPRLLLLDEPTSGMTRAESRETAELLLGLRDRGAVDAMIIVEHDLDFISLVSDRVMVLRRGEVLAEGTAAEVQADPAVRDSYLGRHQ